MPESSKTESNNEHRPLLEDIESYREYKNAELLFDMKLWLPGFTKHKLFLIVYIVLPIVDIGLDYTYAGKLVYKLVFFILCRKKS